MEYESRTDVSSLMLNVAAQFLDGDQDVSAVALEAVAIPKPCQLGPLDSEEVSELPPVPDLKASVVVSVVDLAAAAAGSEEEGGDMETVAASEIVAALETEAALGIVVGQGIVVGMEVEEVTEGIEVGMVSLEVASVTSRTVSVVQQLLKALHLVHAEEEEEATDQELTVVAEAGDHTAVPRTQTAAVEAMADDPTTTATAV